jgi:hypothetical protein
MLSCRTKISIFNHYYIPSRNFLKNQKMSVEESPMKRMRTESEPVNTETVTSETVISKSVSAPKPVIIYVPAFTAPNILKKKKTPINMPPIRSIHPSNWTRVVLPSKEPVVGKKTPLNKPKPIAVDLVHDV